MSLSGWDRRVRKTGLRPKKSCFAFWRIQTFFKGNRSDYFAQFLSDCKQNSQNLRKKRLQNWGSIWELQQTWKDIGSLGCTLSSCLISVIKYTLKSGIRMVQRLRKVLGTALEFSQQEQGCNSREAAWTIPDPQALMCRFHTRKIYLCTKKKVVKNNPEN